jgi:hypothetical protein
MLISPVHQENPVLFGQLSQTFSPVKKMSKISIKKDGVSAPWQANTPLVFPYRSKREVHDERRVATWAPPVL